MLNKKDNKFKGWKSEIRITMTDTKRKGNTMKKIVLTLAALTSMSMAFAEGANNAKSATATTDAAKYEMNINVHSLSNALRLDNEKTEFVTYISYDFATDMAKAAAATGDKREKLYKKAVNKNLAYMHTVLSDRQYRKYQQILNATLVNRGLEK